MERIVMTINSLLMLGLVSLLLLLVAGCGGSSSNPAAFDEEPQAPQTLVLALDQEYEVFAGDMLEPEDEDTRIAVRHVYEDDKKFVTLLAGSATLVYGTDLQR
jgi:hypothetical protein